MSEQPGRPQAGARGHYGRAIIDIAAQMRWSDSELLNLILDVLDEPNVDISTATTVLFRMGTKRGKQMKEAKQ